jgi:hypothetical protein
VRLANFAIAFLVRLMFPWGRDLGQFADILGCAGIALTALVIIMRIFRGAKRRPLEELEARLASPRND